MQRLLRLSSLRRIPLCDRWLSRGASHSAPARPLGFRQVDLEAVDASQDPDEPLLRCFVPTQSCEAPRNSADYAKLVSSCLADFGFALSLTRLTCALKLKDDSETLQLVKAHPGDFLLCSEGDPPLPYVVSLHDNLFNKCFPRLPCELKRFGVLLCLREEKSVVEYACKFSSRCAVAGNSILKIG